MTLEGAGDFDTERLASNTPAAAGDETGCAAFGTINFAAVGSDAKLEIDE
jgi:hypothetical protein